MYKDRASPVAYWIAMHVPYNGQLLGQLDALYMNHVTGILVLRVHQALDGLAAESPVQAELVKLRFFGGLSHQEAAQALGISRATADRYWAYAKAWLFAALEDQDLAEK